MKFLRHKLAFDRYTCGFNVVLSKNIANTAITCYAELNAHISSPSLIFEYGFSQITDAAKIKIHQQRQLPTHFCGYFDFLLFVKGQNNISKIRT